MAQDLRSWLTGAVLRSIIGLRDVGEVIAAFIGSSDNSETSDVDDDKADVWVTAKDHATERIITGRLHVPANILWSKPRKDASVTVLRPADTAAPGSAIIMHGDGGTNGMVPAWYGEDDAGISFDKKAHVESTKDDVVIEANADGKKVDINATGAGGTVNVNGTDYSLLKTEDLLTDLGNFAKVVAAIALSNVASLGSPLVGTTTPAADGGAGNNAAELAILVTKLSTASNYKSTKAKNG